MSSTNKRNISGMRKTSNWYRLTQKLCTIWTARQFCLVNLWHSENTGGLFYNWFVCYEGLKKFILLYDGFIVGFVQMYKQRCGSGSGFHNKVWPGSSFLNIVGSGQNPPRELNPVYKVLSLSLHYMNHPVQKIYHILQ